MKCRDKEFVVEWNWAMWNPEIYMLLFLLLQYLEKKKLDNRLIHLTQSNLPTKNHYFTFHAAFYPNYLSNDPRNHLNCKKAYDLSTESS